MRLALFHDKPSSEPHYERFRKENVLERLHRVNERASREGLEALDPSDDPLIPLGMEIDASGKVTKNSYGVFNLSWQAQAHSEWADQIAGETAGICRSIKNAHGMPLRFLIWAGMGGSVEDKSMYQAVGLLRRGPRFYALDSTDPAKLKYILEDIGRRSGLSLPDILRSTLTAGMALGMTSYEPVVNLEKLTALYQRHKIDSRANFIYMTLPGSVLDQFAGPRGYRKIELQLDNNNSTAGRHSAPLTRGSLYPLALAGHDIRAWIEGTFLSEEEIGAAFRLAAFIHAQGEAGRDKVTLLLPKRWAGAALWIKQDFEESLGKREDLGIKVIHEKPKPANYRSPKDSRQDRMVLSVQFQGGSSPEARKATLLRHAGYPVSVLHLPPETSLSRYMQFIHYVVFGIGYLRQMNFVTQPSVELYKAIANQLHAEGGQAWRSMSESPRQAAWRGISLHYDRIETKIPKADAPAIYAAILKQLAASRQIEYGELTFYGDTRYSPQGQQLRKCLDRGAERVFRSRMKMPVDVYEGPAMNHSYHEMIIGHGKCLSTVLLSEKQETLPAANYGPEYHMTQFLATKMALEQRKRPVVAMTLKDLSAPTLSSLDEFFRQTAALLRNGI